MFSLLMSGSLQVVSDCPLEVFKVTECALHRAGVPVKDPSKKGKTLQELEEEEGGTIKESQVPMAQLKRAQKRTGKAQTEGTHIYNIQYTQNYHPLPMLERWHASACERRCGSAGVIALLCAAETELVGVNELEDVEEALEVEEDEGVTLEPFNLAQERREGYFDEGGHYVENRNKDEEELEKDAWLTSSKGPCICSL